MKVWVLQGIHEGDLFSSVHFTEKGVALAAVFDVLEFLGIDSEQNALRCVDNQYPYRETDIEQPESPEWRPSILKDMTRDQLWKVFGEWNEMTWDNPRGYQLDVCTKMIEA